MCASTLAARGRSRLLCLSFSHQAARDRTPRRYSKACFALGRHISAHTPIQAASNDSKTAANSPCSRRGLPNPVSLRMANRKRVKGDRGKDLLKSRGELVERTFAHAYETGGMRRTHLRGQARVRAAATAVGRGAKLRVAGSFPSTGVACGEGLLMLIANNQTKFLFGALKKRRLASHNRWLGI